MLGAAYDTTAVHSAAERLGRVLETMSTAFFTLDRDWRFTYLNAAAERILGRRRDELIGQRDLGGLRRPRRAPSPASTTARAMETGEPRSFEQYYPPLDAYFDVRVTPNDDGLSVYFHDITDRVRAEQDARARGARSRRPAPRPGACRSSAPRARGWRARSRSTSCCAILGDVVLNGFGDGLVDRARRAACWTSRATGDPGRARHAQRRPVRRRAAGAAGRRAARGRALRRAHGGRRAS